MITARQIEQNWMLASTAKALGAFVMSDVAPSTKVIVCRYWYRDCDCAESTNLQVLPADWNEIQKWVETTDEWAEGPWTLTVLSQDEVREFRSESRDRVMEAFEDGHSFRV